MTNRPSPTVLWIVTPRAYSWLPLQRRKPLQTRSFMTSKGNRNRPHHKLGNANHPGSTQPRSVGPQQGRNTMPEMTTEEMSKEMARQAILHVIETLEERGMTVQRRIPSVRMTVKYEPSKHNPVTLMPRMPHHKADDMSNAPCATGIGTGWKATASMGCLAAPASAGPTRRKSAGAKAIPPAIMSWRNASGFLRWQRTCCVPTTSPPTTTE